MSLTEDEKRVHWSTHGPDSWLRISNALCLVHDSLTSRKIEINNIYSQVLTFMFHLESMQNKPE